MEMLGCLCSQLQGSNHLLPCLVGLKRLGLDRPEVNMLGISLNTYSYVQICGISLCTHCPVEQLGVVVEIIMIVVVVIIIIMIIIMATATVIGCFLCALYCSKHFTDRNSFNLCNSPTERVLLLSPFYSC